MTLREAIEAGLPQGWQLAHMESRSGYVEARILSSPQRMHLGSYVSVHFRCEDGQELTAKLQERVTEHLDKVTSEAHEGWRAAKAGRCPPELVLEDK